MLEIQTEVLGLAQKDFYRLSHLPIHVFFVCLFATGDPMGLISVVDENMGEGLFTGLCNPLSEATPLKKLSLPLRINH